MLKHISYFTDLSVSHSALPSYRCYQISCYSWIAWPWSVWGHLSFPYPSCKRLDSSWCRRQQPYRSLRPPDRLYLYDYSIRGMSSASVAFRRDWQNLEFHSCSSNRQYIAKHWIWFQDRPVHWKTSWARSILALALFRGVQRRLEARWSVQCFTRRYKVRKLCRWGEQELCKEYSPKEQQRILSSQCREGLTEERRDSWVRHLA